MHSLIDLSHYPLTGLHAARLLVGVGHNATDEVGLGLVEGGHQVVELALEVGGDSLAALALLPVLVLGSLQGLKRKMEVNFRKMKQWNIKATQTIAIVWI